MKQKILFAVLFTAMLFTACKEEFLAPDISGMETADYVLNIGDKLTLAPNITNLKGNDYVWLLDGKEVASGETDYTFTATQPGNYIVIFKATNKGGTGEKAFKILVEKEIAIAFENTEMTTPKLKVLEIKPKIEGPDRKDYEYEWAIGESVIGKEAMLDFIQLKPGNYTLTLKVSAGKQSATATCKVKVEEATYWRSPVTLFDFRSAPGNDWSKIGINHQTNKAVNLLYPYPEFLQKASEYFKQYIFNYSLNSWGSYVIFGFDHSVINVPSQRDMRLAIETFLKYVNPFMGQNLSTIYVAQDKNKNGKPDDEWFEIKNVDYGKETVKDYERTYNLLEVSAKDIGDDKYRLTTKYEWIDNQKGKGEGGGNEDIPSNGISYLYPGIYFEKGTIKELVGWEKSFTLKGKLVNKRYDKGVWGSPTVYVNIDDAVNDKGEPANLRYIDFVKVQRTAEVYWEDGKRPEVMLENIKILLDNHLSK